MKNNKTTFALFFGNRGFFAESLIATARKEISESLKELGYGSILMPAAATRFGAVETAEEGAKFAAFLKKNTGLYDGVIICLPNFGDETGAVAAVKDAGVPILVMALSDELDKMDMSMRRDSFCGKISVMDVLYQYGVPYTCLPPHTVLPGTDAFSSQVNRFAGICRVVNGMKRLTIGAIGARTTPFKTIRFDELTLQKYGLTTETLDLSEVFRRIKGINKSGSAFKNKRKYLSEYTSWKNVPKESLDKLSLLSVVLDEIIDEYKLDALALRCWLEIEKELGVSPCVLLSELNNRGITASCELDVCNAVAMKALKLASREASACLDWNNNYGDEDDKCILFHCGPVAASMMSGCGQITDHPMFAKDLGKGKSFGCNTGRIRPSPFTYASSKTENGKLRFYLGEGEFTDDRLPEDFFGCAGVVRIDDLQKKIISIVRQGYRHHVSVTFGNHSATILEAFKVYLGYETEMHE